MPNCCHRHAYGPRTSHAHGAILVMVVARPQTTITTMTITRMLLATHILLVAPFTCVVKCPAGLFFSELFICLCFFAFFSFAHISVDFGVYPIK